MLDFISERYAACLDKTSKLFLTDFRALPVPAQRAFVRLSGRKGGVFNIDKLAYPEIPALDKQFEILHRHGFVKPVSRDHYRSFISVLTKPELIDFMNEAPVTPDYKKSWKKKILEDLAFDEIAFEDAPISDRFIAQGRVLPLRFLLYLYFGKIQDNLQNFTMRDLGLIRTPDFKTDYSARFDDVEAAQICFYYADANHRFRFGTDNDIATLIDSIDAAPEPVCDIGLSGRDTLLQNLGGLSERMDDIDTALSLYARSDSPLCNERTIRLRYKQGDRDWVKTRLEAIIENPASDDECHFAEDFYARKYKKKRTSHVTDILRAGSIINIDEAHRDRPESAAIQYYRDQGHIAFGTENHLWRAFFGLLFWDEIFHSKKAALHNSFERLPASLKNGTFYEDFKVAIEDRLASLSDIPISLMALLKTISGHYGQPNGIFYWDTQILERLKLLLQNAPVKALAAILRMMAQDYPNMKDGFPDLMVIREGKLSFIEIKAQGDVIRRNQLTRIRQMQTAGLDTEIARINWIVDPEQIYVVVDVETTGGKSDTHRLTEIGAVKVKGGEIIGEWQSLINPERNIPAFITRLTGISQEMVSTAPVFAEIADSFEAFMGRAIFVAHNVNFDYGFISAEYKRLDRYFRFPKLCTVVSMRKYYPGYRSYSLKNLCANFDINLDSHHRALCDAKAAAELLKLVNVKRLEL